jgi:hypothetical protein
MATPALLNAAASSESALPSKSCGLSRSSTAVAARSSSGDTASAAAADAAAKPTAAMKRSLASS